MPAAALRGAMNRVFMVLMGGFFAVWGTWELLEMAGYVADARFPWPLIIIVVGVGMLVGAATGRGWGCWGADDRTREPGKGP